MEALKTNFNESLFTIRLRGLWPALRPDPAARVPRSAFRRALLGFRALVADREQALGSFRQCFKAHRLLLDFGFAEHEVEILRSATSASTSASRWVSA